MENVESVANVGAGRKTMWGAAELVGSQELCGRRSN